MKLVKRRSKVTVKIGRRKKSGRFLLSNTGRDGCRTLSGVHTHRSPEGFLFWND